MLSLLLYKYSQILICPIHHPIAICLFQPELTEMWKVLHYNPVDTMLVMFDCGLCDSPRVVGTSEHH